MTSKSIYTLATLTLILYFSDLTQITAQNRYQQKVDSLLLELPKAKEDTNKVNLLNDISFNYNPIDPKKGLAYAEQGFALAEEINWTKGKAITMTGVGMSIFYTNAYAESIPPLIQAIDLAEQAQLESTIAICAYLLSLSYERVGEKKLALQADIKATNIFRKLDHRLFKSSMYNTCKAYISNAMYPEALTLAAELYDYSKARNNELGESDAVYIRGSVYHALSNYPSALQNYFDAVRLYEKHNVKSQMRDVYSAIATIFQTQKEYPKALEYYDKSLALSRATDDKETTALMLSNIGTVYDFTQDKKLARSYYEQALEVYDGLDNQPKRAMTVYNIGGVYLSENDFANALLWFERALKISRDKNDFYTAVILGQTGEAYRQIAVQNDSIMLVKYFGGDKTTALETAIMYEDSCISFLTEQGELKYRAFYLRLKSEMQAELNHYEDALVSYKQYVGINDSLFNIERDRKLVQAEMGYEFSRKEDSLNLASTKQKLELQNKIELQALAFEYDAKQAAAQSEKEKQQLAYEEAIKRQQIENEYARKQAEAEALNHQRELERKQAEALNKAELKRQRNIRNSSLAGASGLLFFLIVVVRQRNKVKKEKARSEELLLNILPEEIAEELKAKGKADARDFEMVSILFTDFKGFTQMSATLNAGDLVSRINECFEAFDHIMGKYGIEKIKTIGDSYMAAGGIPVPNESSIKNTVLAALEMQVFITKRKADMDAKGLPAFEMRAGIHTGPIVAGIVGVKKFQYDIWGDTVNTASRMESAGEIGKVNISQRTYELLKDDSDFVFESRGKIEAKGKGEMDMWFVSLK